MLAQPGVPEYCGVPAEFRHREERSFGVVVVSKNDLYDFTNHTGLIQCTIDVEDRDRLDELLRRDFVLSNIIFINKESGGAAVDECGSATLDTR